MKIIRELNYKTCPIGMWEEINPYLDSAYPIEDDISLCNACCKRHLCKGAVKTEIIFIQESEENDGM